MRRLRLGCRGFGARLCGTDVTILLVVAADRHIDRMMFIDRVLIVSVVVDAGGHLTVRCHLQGPGKTFNEYVTNSGGQGRIMGGVMSSNPTLPK